MRGSEGTLYRDGERCCLGFLGLACGLTDSQMVGSGTPEDVLPSKWPDALVEKSNDYGCSDTSLCNQIVSTNDDIDLEPAERERLLTELFSHAGIEVEFRDGVGP